jgi:hypothetical protein
MRFRHRLGGWESLDMVLRYTRSVRFKESLRMYWRWRNDNSIRERKLACGAT